MRTIVASFLVTKDDLSVGKSAVQRPQWSCSRPDICRLFQAENAVDRNVDTCIRTEVVGYRSQYQHVQWQVDLGDIRSIHNIRILFKSYGIKREIRQRGRFAGFSLYLSNTTSKDDGYLCYKDGPELPPLDFNTTCIKHGRYLTFYNERLLKISYPDEYESMVITELCEVMVYGCENSAVYGSNCNTSCPSKCQEQRCDLINGTCLGCVLGWKGDFCDQSCLAGTFGLECNGSCSGQCKDNETCDHVTGLCPNGCAHGWTGSYCQRRCPLGTYGRNCIYNCSGHCLQNTYCERENGHCLNGCDPGYIGQLCDTECPQHTFGKDCKDNCSGHCLNGETCRYNDGVCNNGCIAGYIGIRCEKVCPEGFYGSSCTAVCSKSCIDICEHTDGKCSCAPGWMGSPNCSEECPSGFYGVNCLQSCSKHCKNGKTCSRFDGSCPEGCLEPYEGLTCDYNKDALTGEYISGLGFSVSLNIIALLAIIVTICLVRRKYIFILKNKRRNYAEQLNSNTTTTCTKSKDGYTDNYEELNEEEKKNSYEGLSISNCTTTYQNLSFQMS